MNRQPLAHFAKGTATLARRSLLAFIFFFDRMLRIISGNNVTPKQIVSSVSLFRLESFSRKVLRDYICDAIVCKNL